MDTWRTTLWKLNINNWLSLRCIKVHHWVHLTVEINACQWTWVSIRDAPNLLEVDSCCRISTKFKSSFTAFNCYPLFIFLIMLGFGHLNQACLGSFTTNVFSFDDIKPLSISRLCVFAIIFSHFIGTNLSSYLSVFSVSTRAASLNTPPIGFANIFVSRWTRMRLTYSFNIQ